MKRKGTAKKGKQPSGKKSAAGKRGKAASAKTVVSSDRGSGTGRKKRSAVAAGAKDKARGKIGRPVKSGITPEAAVSLKTPGDRPPAIKEILTELPEEYGENEFFLIPVEPRVVYASWEITGDSLAGEEDDLEVRFFQVTGREDGESDTRAFLGIDISKRVGSAFFNVGIHGSEIIAEIGQIGADGHFRPLLRSGRVLVPTSLEPADFGEGLQLPETGSYGSRPPDR